jgi:hypothetical protein
MPQLSLCSSVLQCWQPSAGDQWSLEPAAGGPLYLPPCRAHHQAEQLQLLIALSSDLLLSHSFIKERGHSMSLQVCGRRPT